MPELDTITIKGFKSIASVEALKLGAINIVVGPNGSGKSNFIGVFSFLHALREGHLENYVLRSGGADKILHFGSKVTEKLHIGISFNGGATRYDISIVPNLNDELIPSSEVVLFSHKDSSRSHKDSLEKRGKEAGISDSENTGIATYVRGHLNSLRLYHFHDTSASSPMKKTAAVNDNRFLRADGSNLAPYLYYLRKKHASSYSLIRRTVQRVAPFFDDFQLEPQRLNPKSIILEWKHKGSEAYFDASSLSDGTLRFIALATLFLQPEVDRPSVILVDEPELGLHPYAIAMLASLIKQASVSTQVILSTQSPLLLDDFTPEDILVADRVNGGTQFRRLETERLKNWLDDYSLGQLWEKNELGGRPVPE